MDERGQRYIAQAFPWIEAEIVGFAEASEKSAMQGLRGRPEARTTAEQARDLLIVKDTCNRLLGLFQRHGQAGLAQAREAWDGNEPVPEAAKASEGNNPAGNEPVPEPARPEVQADLQRRFNGA